MRYLLYIKEYTFILFVLAVLCQCSSKASESEIAELFNMDIQIIDTLPIYSPNIDSLFIESTLFVESSKLKLITHIDGTCSSCVEDLIQWKELIETLKNEKLQILIYFHTNNLDLYRTYFKRLRFNHDVIIDKENVFLNNNQFPEGTNLHTVLLDENNEIMLIGNPIKDMAIKELYYEVIINHKYQTGVD